MTCDVMAVAAVRLALSGARVRSNAVPAGRNFPNLIELSTILKKPPRLENFDLHNHSTRSDGLLSPTALIELAHRTGTDSVALTDHDTVEGIAEAAAAARRVGVGFIPGVEISVSWGETTLHVVGLNVDPTSQVLLDGLESIRVGRLDRARRIAAALEQLGFAGTFDGA